MTTWTGPTDRPNSTAGQFRSIAIISGAILVVLALTVRLGWLAGWRQLATFGLNSVAMPRILSLAFLVLGLILLCAFIPGIKRVWNWWLRGTAAFLLLFILFRGLEIYTAFDFNTLGWDLPLPATGLEVPYLELLDLQGLTPLPALAAALLVLSLPAKGRAAHFILGACAILLVAFGLVFMLGYFYEAAYARGETMIPTAFPAAIGYIVIGIGLAAVNGPATIPLSYCLGPSVNARLLRTFLPFTAATVCLVALLMHLVSHRQLPSVAAFISAILIVLTIFPVSLLCARLTRMVGAGLERAELELRDAEARSRQFAADLQELNASLEKRVAERTAALEQSRDSLDQFFTITTAMQDPHTVEKAFDLVLEFCRRLGYTQAMISLVDREKKVISAVKAAGGMSEVVAQTVRPLAGGDVLAVAVREGKTICIEDSLLDPLCEQSAVRRAGIRGQVVLPLHSGGMVLGTLQVASPDLQLPEPDRIRTLEGLAAQAARALGNLLHHKEINRLNSQLADRNRQLQKLADDLAATAKSEREALVALQESEHRLQAILDNTTAVVYLKDVDSRFLLINRRFETLFHISRQEAIGKNNHDLFPAEWADVFRANDLKVLESRQPLEFEEMAPQDDGMHTYISIKFPLFNADGSVYGVCGISTDITERKRSEEQLRQQNVLLKEMAESEHRAHEALKQAQGRLVQSEKLVSLGQLVAGVAHEINNPLSFVSNNVAVLQRDVTALRRLLSLYAQSDEAVHQALPAVHQAIKSLAADIDLDYTLANLDGLMSRSRDGLRRIQQIVKDLRDFARLDQGDLHEVDINDGVESTVNIILGQAKKEQVSIELALGQLPKLLCYPAKINQVILNLLGNAIDACSAGGSVTLATRAVDEGVEISVRDNGHGIPAGIQGSVFDPFFTTKPQGKGTGLGLSISYGIVRAHGGHIDFVSSPGEGTTFRIWLPRRPPPELLKKESQTQFESEAFAPVVG